MVKGVVNYSFIYFTVFTANDRAHLQNSKQKRRPSRLRLIAPEPSGPATARVKHKLAFFYASSFENNKMQTTNDIIIIMKV